MGIWAQDWTQEQAKPGNNITQKKTRDVFLMFYYMHNKIYNKFHCVHIFIHNSTINTAQEVP